ELAVEALTLGLLELRVLGPADDLADAFLDLGLALIEDLLDVLGVLVLYLHDYRDVPDPDLARGMGLGLVLGDRDFLNLIGLVVLGRLGLALGVALAWAAHDAEGKDDCRGLDDHEHGDDDDRLERETLFLGRLVFRRGWRGGFGLLVGHDAGSP